MSETYFSEKTILYCPACAKVFAVSDENALCPDCGNRMNKTGISKTHWLEMSVEERTEKRRKFAAEETAKKEAEIAIKIAIKNMLVTTGNNFEGYKITKYAGVISGDGAISVNRGTAGVWIGGEATNAGQSLMESMGFIRAQALANLKGAAYDLGCNAIIGINFDYITLEPETANDTGGTTYLPYVFSVTANGTAVVIEKIG